MNKSEFSVFAWGVYVAVAGAGFLFIPNALLPLLGLPTTTEVWIRVIGLLVLIVGYYYIYCARASAVPFIQVTVQGCIAFFIGLVALVVMGLFGAWLVNYWGGRHTWCPLDLVGSSSRSKEFVSS